MTDERPPRSADILDVLDDVTLEIGAGQDCRTVCAHVSRVLDDAIVVALPKEALDLARSRDSYDVRITRAARDVAFVASARRVAGNQPSGSLLTLELEGEWQRIQRRSDVRLRIMLKTQLEIPTGGEEYKIIDATLLDVSAGGMLIQSKHDLSESESLTAIFKLPDRETAMEMAAEVVRVVPFEDGRRMAFRIGLRFKRPLDRERTRIVRFIFREQARVKRLEAEREWRRSTKV